jgi:hypothetical protein
LHVLLAHSREQRTVRDKKYLTFDLMCSIKIINICEYMTAESRDR